MKISEIITHMHDNGCQRYGVFQPLCVKSWESPWNFDRNLAMILQMHCSNKAMIIFSLQSLFLWEKG